MTPKTRKHKTILRLGRHGRQVRVFVDTRLQLVRCRWTEHASVRTESWPDTEAGREEACAYAEGTYERLTKPATPAAIAPLTLRELWEAYWLSIESDVRAATTAIGYRQRWNKFEIFAGRDRPVTEVTPALLDEYRKALATLGHVPNQIRLLVAAVRRIVRWGVHNDRVPMTKVLEYRVKSPKGKRALPMHEYRRDEAERLIAQFDPRTFHGWRPYVMLVLSSMTGRRARSLLHVEWPDITLADPTIADGAVALAGSVHWRPEIDKMWEDQTRPLPPAAVEALWIAYGWHLALGVTSPFVFCGAQDRTSEKPWTYSASVAQLHDAEDRAGVEHIKFRAWHGFRRGVVGDLLAATGGNYKVAADYIGDRDLRVVRQSYDKERWEDLVGAADLLTAAQASVKNGTETERGATSGAATRVRPATEGVTESQRSGLNRGPRDSVRDDA